MAEIVVGKSEWTVKFAGSHSCAGLGESRGKKLGVAPRSSDLSSWWQNISEGHGLYGEGRIVGMIQIFKNKTRSFRLNHFLRRNDLVFVHFYAPNSIFFHQIICCFLLTISILHNFSNTTPFQFSSFRPF